MLQYTSLQPPHHQYLNKAKHKTGDAFLLWRLKGIIANGEVDVQGEIKNMKDFEVKAKSAQPETAENLTA